MKTMKRTLSVLLAMMMALALAIPAFAAAPTYSITINNDQTGHTYEAYQIFAGDVASKDEQDATADPADDTTGPILSNIIWGKNIEENPTRLIQALIDSDVTAFDSLVADTSTAADVAKALAVAANAATFAELVEPFLTGTPTTSGAYDEGTNTYTISGLAGGYYLVKDKDGELEGDAATATDYIVQVLGNVTMEPKDSDIPTVEKKVYDEEYAQEELENIPYGAGYNDVADWDIGDSVPFKLIATIPQNIDSYETYQFIFNDTLSAGLTLDADSIKVFVAETTAANVNQFEPQDESLYEVTVDGNGQFAVSIPDIKKLDSHEHGANYVIVTYDATLNTNAVIGLDGNPNSVSLQFSNDPNGEGLGQTANDTVIVFTYELDGTKVDDANPETKLKDAQFVLFNGGHTEVAIVNNGKMSGWLKVNTEAAAGGVEMPETYEEWTALNQTNNVILTSDANGLFNISGLDDGTYYLREIKAPTEYNLMEEDVKIVISADTANGQEWNGVATDAFTALTIAMDDGAAQNGNLADGIVAITVTNNRGALLPETGGMGTTIFYIIGGVLVLGVVVILVARKRAER